MRSAGALRINELEALLRLRWAGLDAGRGMPGGSGGYGWAAALAHIARCAALPECYAPWRAALARAGAFSVGRGDPWIAR